MTSSSNQQKVLFIFTTAPYSNAVGREGLDALLSAASLEQEVSAVFMHDGVFQLKCEQDVTDSSLKQHTKTFQALGDFGVELIGVFDTSLLARGLSSADLMVETTELSAEDIVDLIQAQHKVYTF